MFNSGILATGAVPGAKYDYAPASPEIMERVRRIEAVCARHATPLRRAALAFALAHPAVISVIIGAVKPEEPRSNAAELAQPIPAALWADLKSRGPPGEGRRRSGLSSRTRRRSCESSGSRPCRWRAGARHRR